eukprot:Skav225501  [mRNA]  locus=scaffold1721:110746:114136:- [translate_table: standard]
MWTFPCPREYARNKEDRIREGVTIPDDFTREEVSVKFKEALDSIFGHGQVSEMIVAKEPHKKRKPDNSAPESHYHALDVSVLSAMVSAAGMGALLAEAATITALLVLGLTMYTFRSKRDFSFLGAMLWPMSFALFAFGLLSLIFPSLHTGIMGLIVSFAGAGIFCAYLVFDTWRIAHELQVDDYIEGAVQLYVDIVNIFIYILDILMQLSKGDRES